MKYQQKSYIKTYLDLLYQNTSQNNIISKQLLKKYKNILLNQKFINISSLINESKEYIFDIPLDFILEIVNQSHSILLYSNFQIKNFFKQSKHYRNIKNYNFNDLIIGKFNFFNIKQIFKFHKELGFNQNDANILTKAFINKIQNNSYGAYDYNTNILFLNTFYNNQQQKQACYHQLSHFIQKKFRYKNC